MGSAAVLVDKMVGDAYPNVKKVADNMQAVLTVSGAISSSGIGTPLIAYRGNSIEGQTGDPGETLHLPFDDLDIDHTKIVASHVCVIGNVSGDLYFADSGVFTAVVKANGLWITLKDPCPDEVTFAAVEWFFIYEG